MTETTDSTAEKTPPLTPMSLPMLLARIEHEWTTRKRIFDLPTARFWKPDPDIDLSFEFLGRPAASPVGPAAGPHSQMAQNIVLSWLGGARLFELKTVQILDELEIARPCIDMQTIGYNIEWSQELLVHESLEEYVKAWMIIEMLEAVGTAPRVRRRRPGPARVRHVGRLRPRRHPVRQGRRLHRRDARRDRRDRAAPRADPRRLGVRTVPRPRVPDPHLRHDHAVDVPRLPARRDRGDHEAPDHATTTSTSSSSSTRRCSAPTASARSSTTRSATTYVELVPTGVRRRPAVRSGDHADRRAAPVRPRPRSPLRHQADEHARGPQPQGLDARRDDVPLGCSAPRARHRGARQAGDAHCPAAS